MKKNKIMFGTLISLLLVGLLSSCLFPEKFDATIDIKKDGTFSLTYKGILTFIPARASEIKEGKLSTNDEQEIKKLEKEFLDNPDCKKAKYIGHGQFEVIYERQGALSEPIYFLNSNVEIVSLIPLEGNKVEVKGMKLSETAVENLKELQMTVDGKLKLTTDGKVIQHNATSKPLFGGLIGTYNWQIKSVEEPAPYMLIQLGEATSSSSRNPAADSDVLKATDNLSQGATGESDKAIRSRTLADMRALATALGSFMVDTNKFPVQSREDEWNTTLLSSRYYKGATKDGWGTLFRYWSNGKEYRLTSYGKDKKAGGSGFDADIIYVNGRFIAPPDIVK